jgi:hypothetical protein
MMRTKKVWKVDEKVYFAEGDRDDFIKVAFTADDTGVDLEITVFDGQRATTFSRYVDTPAEKVQVMKLLGAIQVMFKEVSEVVSAVEVKEGK